MACDLRRYDTQWPQPTLAETGMSGFEFPWGHHKQAARLVRNRRADLRKRAWRRVANSTLDGTRVPSACLVGEKRADDERFWLALSGTG